MATSNSTILGRFMLSGTTDVQQRLGFPNSKGTAIVKRLFDPLNGDIYNDFANFLVNRIGYSFAHQMRWENPLKEFIKQKLYYGSSVEETMLGWIRGHSYDMEAETQFKTHFPEGVQAFHSINHQVNYPISVSRENMRRAFVDETGLNQLVASIMAQPMNADEYDMYSEMLELFKRYDENYKMARVQCSAVPTDKATADEFLQELQQMAYDITVPTCEWNAVGLPVFAKPDELVLFVRSDVMAATNVQSLAAAYNLDKVDIQYRLKVIPKHKWPMNDNDFAVLTTGDFFQVYPVEYTTTSQVDPVSLKTNYWLHDWSIVSFSPCVPVICFSVDAGEAVPTVTMKTTSLGVSLSDAHVAPGGTIKITPTLNGTLSPTTASDEGVEIAPDGVLYDLTCQASSDDKTPVALNTRTYVDKFGVLHVQKSGLTKGNQINIALTSTYLNPEGKTTALNASAIVTID